MYIKNRTESMKEKKLRATAYQDFYGGETIEEGTVIADDINNIESEIVAKMNTEKSSFLKINFQEDNKIVLPYEELHVFDISEFVTTSKV